MGVVDTLGQGNGRKLHPKPKSKVKTKTYLINASANREYNVCIAKSDRSFCYVLSMQFVTKGTEFSRYLCTKKDIECCKNIVYRTNTPLSTPFLRERCGFSRKKFSVLTKDGTAYLIWMTLWVGICKVIQNVQKCVFLSRRETFFRRNLKNYISPFLVKKT